ncbi:MAG: radical SAM protein [Euryarchaeota archaeon]|nr:radical SAM protein [Euryarchaeota archaeon]
MRLLLIHPKFQYRGKDLFPIGLGYLASVARDKAEVSVLDENVEAFDAEKIRDINPDIVGITATTPSFSRAVEIVRAIKEINAKARVIMGGTHVTFAPEDALKAGADVVIRGEGEATLAELLESSNLEKIKGISYVEDGKIFHNPDRELIKDLDEVPFPAREYFPLKNYRIMSLVTSRGCPYSCSYCASTRFWRQMVRFRSPENVIEELKQISELGFKLVRFMDSTFTLDQRRAVKICELIKESNTGIKWSCETRADFISDELLEALRNAGCTLLCIGVDSGSQEVLDKCRRSIGVATMKEAFEKIREYGIATRAYVTFSFPGETEKTVRETIRFLEEVKPEQTLLSLATAYPGTELWSGGTVEVHPNWVAKFHGHGVGGRLYFPEGMTKKEYVRLAEEMWKAVKKLNSEAAGVKKHGLAG